MRNILALIGAAAVAFVLAGWYLGWYEISSLPSPNGRPAISVEIKPDKITTDVKSGIEEGVERGGEFVDKLREKKGQDGNKAVPTPGDKADSPKPPPRSSNTPPTPPKDDADEFGFFKRRN